MLKSGVSHYVYMKRVWIFDETLSPACFIYYYTFASPADNFVSSYILFPSQRASKAAPGMCGKERANKGFSGRKQAGETFFFPSPRFPSASPYSIYALVRLAKVFLSFFVLSDLKKKSSPHV